MRCAARGAVHAEPTCALSTHVTAVCKWRALPSIPQPRPRAARVRRRQGARACGIVYALSRDDAEVVAAYLRARPRGVRVGQAAPARCQRLLRPRRPGGPTACARAAAQEGCRARHAPPHPRPLGSLQPAGRGPLREPRARRLAGSRQRWLCPATSGETARAGRQDQGGLRAHHYHAGMSATQRVVVQNRWRAGDLQALPWGSPSVSRRLRPCCAGPAHVGWAARPSCRGLSAPHPRPSRAGRPARVMTPRSLPAFLDGHARLCVG